MLFSLTSILFYLIATVLLGFRLTSSRWSESNGFQIGVVGATVCGAVLHGIMLYQVILADPGFNLGFFNAASLVAWSIVLLLLLGAIARPMVNLGILVLPLAAIAVALALLYPAQHILSHRVGLGVEIHVILSILAVSVVTIAAFQSIFLAFQERSLRQKRLRKILRILPPLQTQESMLFQFISLGFFLLSLSLVSGMAFLDDMFGQHLAHKTILSVLAWAVFAVLLWGRWRFGWRGRKVTFWTLVGASILILAYFGSKLVLEIILGRAWY